MDGSEGEGGGMRRDPFFSFKVGSVPVLLLKAMFDIVIKRRQIRRSELFAKVRQNLGRHSGRVSDDLLNRALAYLVRDGIVEVRGATIYRKRTRAKAGGWTGSLDELESAARRAIAGTVRARKAVRGRKKSIGIGRASGRTDIVDLDEVASRASARSERRFRERDTERFKVPIFFATDRERTADGGFSNSGQHAANLQRGTATVSFPAKHRRGKIETPPFIVGSILPKQRYVQIDRVAPLAKSAFHRKLSGDLQKYEDALFVFVHGFLTSFDTALKRTAQIALDTGFNGAAIAFSWPSRANGAGYIADRDRVGTASDRLADFLGELRGAYPNTAIHLVAHSVGAEITAQAMNKIAAGLRVNQVILQAPDIAATDWNGLANALHARADRVSVYTSANDRALAIAETVRLGSARVGRAIKRAMHAAVDAIDATTEGKDGTFWGHSYGFSERLSNDVGDTFKAVPQTRRYLERRDIKSGTYYVFRRR